MTDSKYIDAESMSLLLDGKPPIDVTFATYVNPASEWAKEFSKVVDRTCEAISQTLLPAWALPFPSCGSYSAARVQQDIESDFIDASALAWTYVLRQQMPPRLAGHWLEESASLLARLGLLWRHACRGCAGKGKSRRRLLRAIMAAAVRELGR